MELLTDFDPSAYVSAPKTDVAGTIALGRQLLAAAPSDLPSTAEICRKALLSSLKETEEGHMRFQIMEQGESKRLVDLPTDNSWSCLKGRLDPYTWLDEARSPDAAKAKELSRKLFPDGLTFIQLEYGAQWAEANWRIKLITDEKLEPELRRLCGNIFVDELLFWHKEYARMVGVVALPRGARPVEERRPNLAALRRKTRQAIIAWQLQLVALHLAGHPGARAALRPTDDYREKLAASAATPTPEPKEPEDPKEPAADPTPADR